MVREHHRPLVEAETLFIDPTHPGPDVGQQVKDGAARAPVGVLDDHHFGPAVSRDVTKSREEPVEVGEIVYWLVTCVDAVERMPHTSLALPDRDTVALPERAQRVASEVCPIPGHDKLLRRTQELGSEIGYTILPLRSRLCPSI